MSNSNGDNEYFSCYEDLNVHCLMLNDKPRVEAYEKAILSQKHMFENKVVMDVGAGTGILSLFCAKAGARRVYSVEASGLAKLALKIVEDNDLTDIIQVIEKRVEEVTLSADEKVDIIVSEWMGFYLLHEGMLESVLTARDRFLRNDGKMFPGTARILAAPCSLPTLYDDLESFHGFNFSVLGAALRSKSGTHPEVMTVKSENLLSQPTELLAIDLNNRTLTGVDGFEKESLVVVSRDGRYQGICMWFECGFPFDREENQVLLNTSPSSLETHWKQTVVVLPEELYVEQEDPVAWKLSFEKSKENPRHYNIRMEMLGEDDVTHPVPCECNRPKCKLIQTIMEQHLEQY